MRKHTEADPWNMKEDCDFQEGTHQKIKWHNSIPNTRGATSLGKILGIQKIRGLNLHLTSVFNLRRIKSEHRKNLKILKIATSKVRLWR